MSNVRFPIEARTSLLFGLNWNGLARRKESQFPALGEGLRAAFSRGLEIHKAAKERPRAVPAARAAQFSCWYFFLAMSYQ